MISAAASLGVLLLWDVDSGLTQVDKFLYSTDNYIKAGALLAVGILNTGVRNECDPALALLTEYVEGQNAMMKITAALGLGMAYVGSQREEVRAHVCAQRCGCTRGACACAGAEAAPRAEAERLRGRSDGAWVCGVCSAGQRAGRSGRWEGRRLLIGWFD
jgi:hypothetical protein